jgi:hypothetical protein
MVKSTAREETLMQKTTVCQAVLLCSVLLAAACTPAQAQTNSYPRMLPLEQYLMPRDAEVTLARSAAPDAISHDASVMVLTSHGYETAVAGRNGWTCIVDRGWAGMLDHPEFWNPNIRAATCLNPAASRSMLPYDRKRAELVLAGRSKEEILAATRLALTKKELPMLEPGAMCYMMSRTNYLSDEGDHAMSHLMFYTADDGTSLGANLANSPIIGLSYWAVSPDAYPQLKTFPPIFVSLIMADKWSDGSSALKR